MLSAYHLPELGADLVAALAALDVQDLPHLARPADPPSLSRDAPRCGVGWMAVVCGGEARAWERSAIERGRGRSRSGWDGGRASWGEVSYIGQPVGHPGLEGLERRLGTPTLGCPPRASA